MSNATTETTNPSPNPNTNPNATHRTSSGGAQLGIASTERLSLIVATILSGLFAGFFVAYQISVTRGLAKVDDMTYVQTFQWINATVQTPEFAVIFFGTFPALAVALILNRRANRPVVILLVCALAMVIATIAITAAGNVPLNRELDAVSDLTPQLAAQARADFEGPWNQLNLVRTLTAVVAGACTAIAGSLRRNASGE